MKPRHKLEFVLQFLETYKLKLKDLEYKNSDQKLKVECEKGHTFFRTFDKLYNSKRVNCPECKKIQTKENERLYNIKYYSKKREETQLKRINNQNKDYFYLIEDVKTQKEFKSKKIHKLFKNPEASAIQLCDKVGYKFISYEPETSYVNLLCKEGHSLRKKLKAMSNRHHQCRVCAGINTSKRCKHSYEHIRDYISEKGETLLSTEYKNSNGMLQIKCNKDHVYHIRFSNFYKGHRCPQCFYKRETHCREIIERISGYKFPKRRPDFMKLGEGKGQTL